MWRKALAQSLDSPHKYSWLWRQEMALHVLVLSIQMDVGITRVSVPHYDWMPLCFCSSKLPPYEPFCQPVTLLISSVSKRFYDRHLCFIIAVSFFLFSSWHSVFFLLRDPLSYFTPLPHCSVLKPHPPTEHNATIVIAFFSSSSPITENAPVMLIAHKDTEHLPAGAPHQIIS